jgi:hypothetical protein
MQRGEGAGLAEVLFKNSGCLWRKSIGLAHEPLRAAADLVRAAQRDSYVADGEELCARIRAPRPLDPVCLSKLGSSIMAVDAAIMQFIDAQRNDDPNLLHPAIQRLRVVAPLAAQCSLRQRIPPIAIRPTRP